MDKMNDEEIEELFVYLRDVFITKYLPTKVACPKDVCKYEPVVKIGVKKWDLFSDPIKLIYFNREKKIVTKRSTLRKRKYAVSSSDSD